MKVTYAADKKLELWVVDTNSLDGFSLFVDGQRLDQRVTRAIVKYDLQRPAGSMIVVTHFGGGDGGDTFIADATDANNLSLVASQSGLRHSYEVVP